MKPVKISTLVFIFFCLSFVLSHICISNAEEDFNRAGFVKNNGTNVKAGDHLNFESLCKLQKGDPVKIIGKRYSWFKIALPKCAYVYIKNDFVDVSEVKNTGIGIVKSFNVNLRAGAGTNYSIVGQVSKPEKLTIIKQIDEWYEIEPPTKTVGWIHSNQISFNFDEVK